MLCKRYMDEFKIEAVKQVTERGRSVTGMAQRLGITTHSLYAWRAKFDKPDVVVLMASTEGPFTAIRKCASTR
ncbi:hypothetical protein LvStA_00068 [Burkholderia gladioli]|nr:hypothetical protein LvStA_00068 [Burkholderia gladioli]